MVLNEESDLSQLIIHHYLNPLSLFRFTHTIVNKAKQFLNSLSNRSNDANVYDDGDGDDDKDKDRSVSYEKFHDDNHSLLKITDVPSHLRFNPWIQKGYRSPKLSTIGCIQSLAYFHNETINILTHGIPLIYFLFFFDRLLPWQRVKIPLLPYFHFFGCVSPWLGSSIYHIFMNHKSGERFYYRLLQWDVIGIWVTQSFGASTTIYTSVVFYPMWFQTVFIGMYVLMSIVALREGLLADKAWKRPASFATIFVMRIIAFGLRIHSNSLRQNNVMQFLHVIMQELWPLIGAFISVTRIPERFWPGLFDYFFNSHNIMHCFVVFGAIHMHLATFDDLTFLSNIFMIQ